jgi:hypothetical protein
MISRNTEPAQPTLPPVVPTAFAITHISSSEVVLTIADPKGA